MFARSLTPLLLVAAMLGCSSAQSTSLNMSNICALLADNSLIASNQNCNTYYQCVGGVATQQTCTSNYYFSKDQQQCLPASQVNCFINVTNPCANQAIGSWVPAAGSCQEFYYCSANGPQLGNCPNDMTFNVNAQMCDYTACTSSGSSDTSTASINLCDFVQNGVYFGSPSACSAWNYCNNGVLQTANCNDNYVFNTNNQLCDYPSSTTCSQVSNDPNLGGGSSTVGPPCTEFNTTKSINGSCISYYWCNGTNYVLTNCQANTYYDTESGACVARMDARNDCNRCAGTTATFVNSYSTTNCTGYLYCQNGQIAGSGTCGDGGFFYELVGGCAVEAEPLYGCCNPNVFENTTDPAPAPAA